jgi:hypothetical protein
LSSPELTVLQVSLSSTFQVGTLNMPVADFYTAIEKTSHLRYNSPVTTKATKYPNSSFLGVCTTVVRNWPLHDTRNITIMHPSIVENIHLSCSYKIPDKLDRPPETPTTRIFFEIAQP